MSSTTAQVQFSIVDDELTVSAPHALEPLDDFFETEIGTSEAMLDLLEHHISHDRTWQFTGDSCRLDLAGENVTIKHTHTGTCVFLTRGDLRTLVSTLKVLLTENGG